MGLLTPLPHRLYPLPWSLRAEFHIRTLCLNPLILMYISFSFNSLVIILCSHKINYNYSQFPDLATTQTNCIIFVFKYIVYICIFDMLFFKLLECELKWNYTLFSTCKGKCFLSISFLFNALLSGFSPVLFRYYPHRKQK